MSDCEECGSSSGEEEVVPKWEIGKEWFAKIMGDYFPVKVQTVDIRMKPKRTKNENVLSDISRFDAIMYSDSYIIMSFLMKRLPKDPFCRFFVTEGQYDLREIKFYTEIVPDLRKFREKHMDYNKLKSYDNFSLLIPQCYYAHYCPPGEPDNSSVPPESILILEDFSDKNIVEVIFTEGLLYGQAEAALDTIARIHAHSLCMKVIDGQPLTERYTFLSQKEKAIDSLYHQLVERGFTKLAYFLEGVPKMEKILEALMALQSKTKSIITNLLAPEGPLALITHMDFWCNNLIFEKLLKTDKLLCSVVDWQMVAYSKPTNDIALLLVSSLPSNIRRKHTESLLDLYWEVLNYACNVLGVNIPEELGYTREDLSKDYRKSQLLALLLCIGSIDIALGHPNTKQRLVDVLQDFYNDGILTDEVAIAMEAVDA